MTGTATRLEVDGLIKSFQGNPVLRGVSLALTGGRVAALSGLNGAGKSTLIKILAGVYPADGGQIRIDGVPIDHRGPGTMRRAGIEVIFQDFALFPNLSVAENIAFSDTAAAPFDRSRRSRARRRARAALALIGAGLHLDVEVGELPIAERQLVAIARALARETRFLILDEPTASLTRSEAGRLFKVVEGLKARGVAVLFISHRYDEVATIADEVFVLRDGAIVRRFDRGGVSAAELHTAMTGAPAPEATRFNLPDPVDEPVLEVTGLARDGLFAGVDLSIRRGEIVGLTGLLGAGKTELAEVLFGLAPADAGEIRVEGVHRRFRSNRDAIAAGIAYLPEDRLGLGLVLPASVSDNIALASYPALIDRLGLVDRQRKASLVRRFVDGLGIKVVDVEAPIARLSGGNQQRAVLAKWLATEPKLLILDCPTVGVDVSAREVIYELIREVAGRGIGVLIISSEVEEVWSMCHRVHIMTGGRLARAVDTGGGCVSLAELEATVHG
ncbi:sugar ABC transporter ATP-binding protein [Pleomorphomonas sp. PLEO]|uniref:sugar ABC transporter ATP-binding protein n=1 Tax=Pleomorphomonas sp. PLEO TaxID=3239306 RepID=UPI00351E0E6E